MNQSPYFSKINVNQSDFSGISRAGDSWAKAYGQLGDAIAKVGSAYFEEKGFEKEAKDWVQTSMGKEYLKGANIEVGDDPSEAEKFVKGMIKSKGGFKEFMSQMQTEMQITQAKEQQERQNYLFEQQKQEIEGKLDHFNRMSGSVKNPKVAEVDTKISSVRTGIKNLTQQLEGGEITDKEYTESFYDLGKKLGNLKNDKSALKDVIPMSELDPRKFAEAYGPVTSPYQAMLKAGTMQKLQERKDKLELESLDTAEKKLRVKNLQDEEKAASMSTSFNPTNRVVFEKGDAMQQVQDFAEANKLQLKPEQMEKMAQQVTVVEPKEILSQKKTYEKENRITEADTVIESSKYLIDFLDTKNDKGENNPLTDTAAIEKLARMLQPTGILTEDDINRVSGSSGLVDRFHRAVQKAKDGTLDEKSRNDLRQAAKTFSQVASELKVKGTESAINEISNAFVNPNDPAYGDFKKNIRGRYFSEEYNNIPKEFLPENQAKSVEEAQDGQNVKVSVKGKEKVVKLLRTLPNGKRVVMVDGKLQTIDPQ